MTKRIAHAISSILLLSSLILPTAVSGQHAVPIDRNIPRFYKVADGFYRGGQPEGKDFEVLQKQGIKTVINLRPENDEKPIVESLGMSYVHIPLSAWDHVPDGAIETFFQTINDPANQPVFVHCRRGADRTGVMVGFYRIAFQGWDARKAHREARALGMRWWYRGLKHQLYEFAEKQKK